MQLFYLKKLRDITFVVLIFNHYEYDTSLLEIKACSKDFF